MSRFKALTAVALGAVLVIVLAKSLHSQTAAPTPTPAVAPTKAPAPSQPAIPCLSHWEALEYKGAHEKALGFRLLKPAKNDPKVQYPLVVFLHGSGERGSDNVSQLKLGVCELFGADYIMRKYPCYAIAPQCPANNAWSNFPRPTDTRVLEPMAMTLELVGALQKNLNIDSRRIYIIGLSMGGYGVWQILENYPDLAAAAVPICGGGDPALAEKFAKVPVWAFHGDADKNVPVQFSRDMIAAMQKAGGNPKYTEYPGVNHFGSWPKAFADPKMLEWMFAQKRETPGTTQPASQPTSSPTK